MLQWFHLLKNTQPASVHRDNSIIPPLCDSYRRKHADLPMSLDVTAMLGTRPEGQEEQATPAHVRVRDTAAPHECDNSLMSPSSLQ